ncbi:hypothetical protein [Providencia sp. PROV260]|uniref:hypothetical protein n=1 Tax=Providencia sp. PROV260 TaxID=2949948 RepID=UPI002349BA0E|nr:hypothetical protein [Providencia sp. PROV260]
MYWHCLTRTTSWYRLRTYSALPDGIRGTRSLADAKAHVLRDCQFRTQTGAHPACTSNALLGV